MNAFRTLGEPGSLSLRTALLFIPAGCIGPLILDPALYGGPKLLWLLVAVIAELVLIGGLLTGRALVHSSRSRGSHPIATVLVFVVTALVRGITIGTVSRGLGLTDQLEVAYRITAGVFFVVAVLLILAIVVSTYDRHRSTVASLDGERARLLHLEATAQDRLARTRARLLQQVRTTVNPRLSEIDEALRVIAAGGDPSPGAASLQSFVEDELRPLSHRLSTELESWDDGDLGAVSRSRPRVPLPERMSVAFSFKPLATGVICSAAAIAPAFRTLPYSGAFPFILAFGLACAGMVLLARQIARRWHTRPLLSLVVVTASYMAIGVGAIRMLPILGIPTPADLEMAATVLCGLIGAMNVCYDAVTARQEATEQQLRLTVAQLQSTVASLNQQAWVAQRRLAYVMHGRIQSSLHAAAMRLTAMSAIGTSTVEEIRRDIASALAELEAHDRTQTSVSATLDSIAELWSGACTVDWSLTPSAERTLDSYVTTAHCVAEISREAISNAIHHGRATQVTCDVVTAPQALVITVTDDGSGWDAKAARGLGSAMYDDLCSRWSASPANPGTILIATVPLST